MKRALAGVGLLALLVGPAFGQTAGSSPSFDAAEEHLRTRTSNAPFAGASGDVLRGGRYDLRNVTMIDLPLSTASTIPIRRAACRSLMRSISSSA
jgi:hypothetical protein